MMDKCKREKDKLYEIACGSEKKYYTTNESGIRSYFAKRDDSIYIREYGFETLPELKEELNTMWKQDEIMQECIQTVLIASLKLKPMDEINQKKDEEVNIKEENKKKLSPFIYNF